MAAGGDTSEGFTIVETLIVLAVSAIVAASTMILISGRQNKTQFMVGSNNLKQHIEQIINETRSGYYPNTGDFTCAGNTTGATPIITPAVPGAKEQGTNDTCVFLGKAVAFGVGQSAADPEVYATYPLVGNRQFYDTSIGAKRDVNKYREASAVALESHGDFNKTQNGLSLKSATFTLKNNTNIPVAKYAVIAFADNLSEYQIDASTGDLSSATEKLNMYYFSPVASATPDWGAVPGSSSAIASGVQTRGVYDTAGPTELKSLDLCFDSGSTSQSAVITITGLGQLSVRLKVNNSSCP